MTENAMYAAYKLASLSWWSCWKRLSVIADEDVGQPEAITTVDVLYRKFMARKEGGKVLSQTQMNGDLCVSICKQIEARVSVTIQNTSGTYINGVRSSDASSTNTHSIRSNDSVTITVENASCTYTSGVRRLRHIVSKSDSS